MWVLSDLWRRQCGVIDFISDLQNSCFSPVIYSSEVVIDVLVTVLMSQWQFIPG